MAKGVLGNDPFLRGAPAREETAIKTPPKPAPPTPAPKPIPPARPRLPPRPAAAGQAAPVPGQRSWPKAADKNKPARQSVRELMSRPPAASAPVLQTPPPRLSEWEPTCHPGSPQMVILIDGVATAHAGSPEVIAHLGLPPDRIKQFVPHPNTPELKAVLGGERIPHHHSPEVAAVLGGPAIAHRGSPEVAAVLGGPAIAHRGSPELAAVLGAPAIAHRGSPELAAVLGAPAIAHRGSPELAAVLGAPAIAHRGSPEVVAGRSGRPAVPHSRSPEAVELQPPAAQRPLVVEIVEESSPEVPMSEREISPRPRSSSPVVALGVAREVFAGGIVRPLAGAARGLFSAARTALSLGAGGELDMWGKDLSLTRSLEPLSDFLYERYFRVTVEGADHVPAGAVILVANHSGALPLDGPMLHLALRRERADLPEARWLMEDQVFHSPFVGVLANRLGAVRANPENATRLLEERRPVAVFPEGIQGISKRFGERYQLKRFGRGGYVKLAVRLKVPIVPVAIVGAEESMPLLARLPGRLLGLPYLPITVPPLPAKWQIRFGTPIDLSQAPDDAEADLAWVARTNDRTRETIEGMLTAMLRDRASVF